MTKKLSAPKRWVSRTSVARRRFAKLKPDEDKAWVFAFNFWHDQGHTDLEADFKAWQDVRREFPRLRRYVGCR